MTSNGGTTDQQFNLRWNNHTSNFLQVFLEQYTNQALVDVTLSAEGKFLKAHKMVLSACSTYFQELFQIHTVINPVVILNKMKFRDIKMIVEFMYRGEVKVLEADIDSLLEVAEQLQVKGLCHVRNKYEKETANNQANNENTPPEDQNENNSQTQAGRLKKKRKMSHTVNELANESLVNESVNGTTHNKSRKDSNELPSEIKIEPPDTKDADEEVSSINQWENSKLIVDENEDTHGSLPRILKRKSRILQKSSLNKFVPIAPKEESLIRIHQKEETLFRIAELKKLSSMLDLKNEGKIPRPPNAFMIFANEWRRRLAQEHPGESNKDISVRLGYKWKNLSSDLKEGYYAAARKADEEHKRKYPGYYYSPKEARLRKEKKDALTGKRSPKNIDAMRLVKVFMPEADELAPYLMSMDAENGEMEDEAVGSVDIDGDVDIDDENNSKKEEEQTDSSPPSEDENMDTIEEKSNE